MLEPFPPLGETSRGTSDKGGRAGRTPELEASPLWSLHAPPPPPPRFFFLFFPLPPWGLSVVFIFLNWGPCSRANGTAERVCYRQAIMETDY